MAEDGLPAQRKSDIRNEFTAIIEKDGEWFIDYCPEIPGAGGQGRTEYEYLQSLSEAIALIEEDHHACHRIA